MSLTPDTSTPAPEGGDLGAVVADASTTTSGSSIWTTAFWKGAGERMLKTFLQSFIPALLIGLGVSGTTTVNVFNVPWGGALVAALGVSLGATFLSLCTSIGNADFTSGS